MFELHLPYDTQYDLFNDRTLMEMIPDYEETNIERPSQPITTTDTPRVPDGGSK